MARSFTNSEALLAAIRKEMQSAMDEVESKGYLAAVKNAGDFYSQGHPNRYKRTPSYGNSAKSTGVIGSGDHLETEIYLDTGFNYSTGSWSTPKIFDAIEFGDGGVLGKTGRWQQTEEDVERIINEAFVKRFG